MKVFVYGALMDDPRIQRAGTPGFVEDHAVRFTAKGFTFLEPRFLALEHASDERAHGVVADLPEAEWLQLAAHEDGYDEREVEVHTEQGVCTALALVLQPEERVEEGLPSGRYADRLVRGAETNGLPAQVVERYRDAAARGPALSRYLMPLVAVVRGLLRR